MNTGVPGQDFPGSDLGMAVQVLENRHGRETIHSMGAGFTLVFVKLAPFVLSLSPLIDDGRYTSATDH